MAKAEYRSAIRSKKLIIEALVDLLTVKSLDKITVTDVVTRADINRGTFYAHYRDIPDVVDHLIQSTFAVIRDTMIAKKPTPDNVILTLLTTFQDILESDLSFFQKILTSSASLIIQEQLNCVLLDFFRENKDWFYPDKQEEYLVTFRFCSGGLSNLYQDWFAGKLSCSLRELTQLCIDFTKRLLSEKTSV